MIEAQISHRICPLCDEVVSDPHDCAIALRFCDRDISAPCSICDACIYAHPLALDFYVTSTERLICEACALEHGIDPSLWSAYKRGIFFQLDLE